MCSALCRAQYAPGPPHPKGEEDDNLETDAVAWCGDGGEFNSTGIINKKKKKRKLKPHCRRHHHLPINPPTHPSIIIISVGLGLFLPVIISFFDLVLGCPSCGSAAPFSAQRFYLLSTRLIFFFSGCWGGGAICFGVARQSKYTLVHPCTANVFRVWASHQPRMRWC